MPAGLKYDSGGNSFILKTGRKCSCVVIVFAASLYQKLIDMLKLNINHISKDPKKPKRIFRQYPIRKADKIQYQSTSFKI
jgi:hypothetical protein